MSLQISALDNFCAEDNFQYVKDIDFSLLDRKEKHAIKVGLKKYIKLLKNLIIVNGIHIHLPLHMRIIPY